MTREEIYNQCVQKIDKTNTLLLEAATGTGKTKISIDLVNHLIESSQFPEPVSILILVAKRVHKQTWKDEIEKWGGFRNQTSVTLECYESMHKHLDEHFNIILADEVHHIGSEKRLELFSYIRYDKFVGLSATIPRKLKSWFRYTRHAEIVSCDLIEAIESDILPEPQILLFPLLIDSRLIPTETWEINARQKGCVMHGDIKDIWTYKRKKVHAILSCTQQEKLREFNKLIEYEKQQYMRTNNQSFKQAWLYHAGKRLEWLTDIKLPVIKDILRHLKNKRTITFCKTIEQAEKVGKFCIHSKNSDAQKLYDDFNQKKINHITAVNILNENANLVDCKYAVFSNLSSSDIVIPQRIGRSLRHKSPVIIIPYYKETREQEIVEKMFADYDKRFIRTIKSIQEI